MFRHRPVQVRQKYRYRTPPWKITWCLRAWWKWLVYGLGIDRIAFRVHGRNWLGFGLRAENFWILVWTSNLISFFRVSSKLIRFQCKATKLTRIERRDRTWLGVCVTTTCFRLDLKWLVICSIGIEIEWFVARGLNVHRFLCWPKIDLFKLMDRNWRFFSVGIGWLSFVPALKLTLFWYVGRKPLGFGVSIKMDLVFVCGPEIARLRFIE